MKNKPKRLLFVLPTAQIGGTRTSLLNLLKHMDKERYQIDVMFIYRRGETLKQFESICNVLPQDEILLAGRESILRLLKSFKLGAFMRSLGFVVKAKIKNESRYELAYKQAAKNYNGKYDCVVSFQEKDSSDFARHIVAPRKLAWVHLEYSRTIEPKGEAWFSYVSNCFDKVVFVSDGCMNEYKEKAHVDHSKMVRVYNTFDTEQVLEKSTEYAVDKHKDRPLIVSVGRCVKEKRFDRIIDASVKLKNDNIDFEWVVIGGGPLLNGLRAAVEQNNLSDRVFFIGQKENPYPYIRNSDFVVVTSMTESFSLVCLEAAILKKPVIVTDYPAAHEVVGGNNIGMIFPNSAEGVYDGVKCALTDRAVLEDLKNKVAEFNYDNKEIVVQVENLIEG